ncbi:MAG: aminopeptidase [Anaerolineales bacterium]
MPDTRIVKLAKVLVHYSLQLKPGQQVLLQTTPQADELSLAFLEEAIKAGAHVFTLNEVPGAREVFLKHASEAQLDFMMPVRKFMYETFDARLAIEADVNTRELAGVERTRIARFRKTYAPLFKLFSERAARGEMKWCLTVYPTQAMAQEANMSLADYREFVYAAGMLNDDDPVAFWQEEAKRQSKLINWLAGRKQVTLKGTDVDLHLSIEGRSFISCAGSENFPDGEIFTSPVENSANGWIRFKYPAIFDGQEVEDIELWFEKGKVVKEQASKNQELLTGLLNTDPGARYLGEWGIGTNYGITHFTKNILFDEKLGGTIHLALGLGFPEAGGQNESGLHWDMLCDMSQAEVTVDGDLFYKDGQPMI